MTAIDFAYIVMFVLLTFASELYELLPWWTSPSRLRRMVVAVVVAFAMVAAALLERYLGM